MKLRKYLYLTLFCLLSGSCFAQLDSMRYKVEAITSVSSSDNLPFWLVNNRNGIVPERRCDLFYVGFIKDYSTSTKSLALDYSFGFDAATSYQYDNKALINQYFASIKYKKMQLFVGAKNTDVLYNGLSFVNNSIVMAGNARNYPQIEISTTDYLNVPFTKGWFAVKGEFSNGWLIDDRYCSNVMLHHKNAYLRIGKEQGFSFEFGVEHYAQWGGVSPLYGQLQNDFDAFLIVIVAKEGEVLTANDNTILGNEADNALGNHVGQNELKFNYNTASIKSTFFMCNMYEHESQDVRELFNAPKSVRDINYGFYMEFKENSILKSFIVEYYSTMFQGREEITSNGDLLGFDSYFNNAIYRSGWSNYKRGIGISLISPTSYNSDGSVVFGNTTLKAVNIGFSGCFIGINYKFKATYHKNYGQVYPSNIGGKEIVDFDVVRRYTVKPPEFQQYYLLELLMPEGRFPFAISTIFALDNGDMYDDNFGMMIKLSKTGFFNKLFKR